MIMDLGIYDNRRNHQVESLAPVISKGEECLMGIDEAGRGPVLGPMVYGTCYCPLSRAGILKKIGFADSKTLTEEQRDGLFVKLNEEKDTLGWIVNVLSPNYISNSMLKKNKYNLNSLSHDTAINLIKRVLELGVNLQEVYVDTVGDPNMYQKKLQSIFPNINKIVVSKKADSLYPIVSAASICAKVARDKAVKEWNFLENDSFQNMEYGSGYPGDPKTKRFLRQCFNPVFGFPQIVRFSWSTAASIINDDGIPIKWEDDDELPEKISNNSVSKFFQPNKTNMETKLTRRTSSKYFTSHHFKSVDNII